MKAQDIPSSLTIKFTFLLLFALTLCPVCSTGQSLTSGDIAGTVLDPTGAAVPGATVTVTSNDTGAKHTATTSSSGGYRFALLNPGSYTVAVAAPGFQSSEQRVKAKSKRKVNFMVSELGISCAFIRFVSSGNG